MNSAYSAQAILHQILAARHDLHLGMSREQVHTFVTVLCECNFLPTWQAARRVESQARV